ncbi:MAG: hypothetical protein ACRDTA_00030 [Pseudonocardiaceae bacterium]
MIPVLRIFDVTKAQEFYVAASGVRELHGELQAALDRPAKSLMYLR